MEDKASIAYWYPRLAASGVPTPRTKIIETSADLWKMLDLDGDEEVSAFIRQMQSEAEAFGTPLFLRSGHTSAKHGWTGTCCLTNAASIGSHIFEIVEFSGIVMPSLPVDTWALREFIPMQSSFRAFHGDMPINRERRFFIEPRTIYCDHPYWPPDAIEQGFPADPEWRTKLDELNKITADDQRLLRFYCDAIMSGGSFELDDAWSVDFAQDVNGKWYAIDMAPAGRSYHWPGCPNEHRWHW